MKTTDNVTNSRQLYFPTRFHNAKASFSKLYNHIICDYQFSHIKAWCSMTQGNGWIAREALLALCEKWGIVSYKI